MSDFKAEDYRLTRPVAPSYGGGELQDQGEPASYGALPPHGDPATYGSSSAGVVSFLSSTERQGRWPLPRQFRALAVMGSVELDLREAEIGYGLSVIEAVAVMGNIEITIPPHITVECDGDSLLGTFTLKYAGKASPTQASRDRVIRVSGTAYAGAVTVAVKGPDEKMLQKLARTFGMERQ